MIKNYHKIGCPWHGVNLNDDIAVDELGGTDPEFDGTPCICTDSDYDEAVQQDIEKHESSQLPPTPGYTKLGPAARERARARAKNFYPFD